MKAKWKFLESFRFQILAPLVSVLCIYGLGLAAFSIVLIYQFTDLQKKISVNASITQRAFQLSRLREQKKEAILLYRMNARPTYLRQVERADIERQVLIDEIEAYDLPLAHREYLIASLVSGLRETEFLQRRLLEAIQSNSTGEAQEFYQTYALLYEINGARLADLITLLSRDLTQSERAMAELLIWLRFAFPVFIMLGFLTVIATVFYYRQRVFQPIQRLQKGMQTVSSGELGVNVEFQRAPSELRDIANEFNRMTTSLAVAQHQLNDAREGALLLAETKSTFLSNMSHEIRTPLNAIVGAADLLEEPMDPSEQKRYIQMLRRSSQLLLSIVNDILDYSRLESGRVTLESTAIDIRELVNHVTDTVRPFATDKSLEFKVDVEDPVPNSVLGDSIRLEQVLLNLLSNAIKFTNDGSVSIKVSATEAEGACQLQIQVADTGIGISREKLSDLFDRFSQADSTITRRFGGTGLGLAIVKQLTELMNGRIDVDSEMGKGSVFTLHLPVQTAVTATSNSEELTSLRDAAPQLHSLRVLLADDSPDNRTLVHAFLKDYASEIVMVENGQAAIEAFERSSFDVILMDIQMPVLDGYSATQHIRQFETQQGREPTPILALTAYALKEEVNKAHRAGCTAHLAKPIRKQELVKTIAGLTRRETETTRRTFI